MKASEHAAMALLLGMVSMGCLDPSPGQKIYQRLGNIALPKGVSVNAMGGNLMLSVDDLSIDTRVGTWLIRRTFNSGKIQGVPRTWRFNFETTYDGFTFVAPDGGVYDVTDLAGIERIPGSQWVRLDATRVKTLGGLVYEFSGDVLWRVYWHGEEGDRYLETSTRFIAGAWRVTGIDQCLSSCVEVYAIDYDSNGRVENVTDRANRRAEYTYDGSGRLATARDGLDVAKGWSGAIYTYTTTTLSVSNSEGESYRVIFDKRDRPREITYWGEGDPTYRFAYGWSASLRPNLYTNYRDPEGNLTRYLYYQDRRLALVEHPLDEDEFYAWGTGLYALEVVLHRRPSHDVTYEYERGGDRVTIDDENGVRNRRIFFTNLSGRESNRSAPNARPTYRVIDGQGAIIVRRAWYGSGNGFRLQYVENGEGEKTTYSYDEDGNLSSIERGGVVTTFSDYSGQHGHPREETTNGNTFHRGYDGVGNLLSNTKPSADRLGVEPGFAYDEDRNLVRWRLRGTTVQQTASYRSDHQVTSIVRPFGGNTTFGYDALGRQTSRTELVAATETSSATPRTSTVEYTLMGQTEATTLPNGMRNEWTYDERGRVLSSVAKRSGSAESSLDYTYNSRGQLESVVSGVGPAFAEFYRYSHTGHVSRVDFTDGEYVILNNDERGRLVTRTYWDASDHQIIRVSDRYDDADREDELVSDLTGDLILTSWGPFGKQEENFGNGMTRYYYYDQGGTLEGTETDEPDLDYCPSGVESSGCNSPDCSVLFGKDWFSETWDRSCDREESTETTLFPSRHQLGQFSDDVSTRDYEWDALSNLTRIQEDPFGGPTTEFVYNATHNRLLRIERPDGSSLDYEYDEAGFVTSRGGQVYDWSARGRIKQMGLFHVDYDPLGRLREVSVTGSSTPIKLYRFGGDMQYDNQGNPVALDLGRVRIRLDGSGINTYRHLDQRGNVKFTTSDPPDGNSDVLQHYTYGAFGLDAIAGDPTDFSHRFAGGMQLGEIVLLGARPYDQEAGRLLAPDPVHQPINQYTYAMGNPVDFFDPDGMEARGPGGRLGEVLLGGGQSMDFFLAVAVDPVVFRADLSGNLHSQVQAGVYKYFVTMGVGVFLVPVDLGIFIGELIEGSPSIIDVTTTVSDAGVPGGASLHMIPQYRLDFGESVGGGPGG